MWSKCGGSHIRSERVPPRRGVWAATRVLRAAEASPAAPMAANCRRDIMVRSLSAREAACLSCGGRLSPLVDERGDQPRPARLMRGAQPRPRVSVEVLVEEDQIPPMRILLELADGSVDGPPPRLGAREDADHPVGDVLRHLPQGERRPALVFRGRHGELGSIGRAELAQGLEHEEGGGEPHRPAPVGVAALDLGDGLRGLVLHGALTEDERIALVELREAPDTMRGEELLGIQEPLEEASRLVLVDDGADVEALTIAVDRLAHPRHDALLVPQEPQEVARELVEGLDPLVLEALHRVEGNEADERAHAELLVALVRIAENVVEETVLLVPQLIVARAHALHGRGHVDVVLEELRGQALVGVVLLGRSRTARSSSSPTPRDGWACSASTSCASPSSWPRRTTPTRAWPRSSSSTTSTWRRP